MSEDGVNFDTFHKKCDNKGITIVFIETEDGYRFGGYTELEWDTSGKDEYDDSTFLFSFNYNEKYIKRNKEYSIGCYKNEGPTFVYGPQISFSTFGNLKNGLSFNNSRNSFVLNIKFVDSKTNWTTKELEVFKITFINSWK